MNPIVDDILMHYGMPRRSGRYPWGSGENPYQHSGDFLSRVESLKKQGLTEKEIADYISKDIGRPFTTTQLRAYKAIAKNERRSLEVAKAKSLRADGKSLNEIAEIMGYKNDSSVRSLLNETSEKRMNQAQATADRIRAAIEEKGMIDVGEGVEKELGCSKEKLNQALEILSAEGYPVYGGGVPQATNPGRQTVLRVIGPPGTEHKDIYDYANIHSLEDYISYDGGESYRKAFYYPESLDSSRLQIKYKEEGGIDMDGVMEIRRGVKDLDLGMSNYAQVRIMVDGTHYLKGMAVYADDLPDGIDIRFNTNKKQGTPMTDVLKPIKDDPSNPFGSAIKEHGGQSFYDDPNGNYIDPLTGKKQSLSLINKRADEGDWRDWSDKVPSQFLAKQPQKLINRQLKLSIDDTKAEFEELCSLTNPTVKKYMLNSFAEDCESAAVHLKAAALPRQKYQVILPLPSLSEREVYAPNFKDGEKVALIRFPHAGTFEIPILTVNNKNPEGQRMIGKNPLDAVGINSKVAERLSGADFDGDTVMVIPTGGDINIKSTNQLRGLKDFDSKSYQYDEKTIDSNGDEHFYRNGREFKVMKNTQTEMGNISNLITDMTLRGAEPDELARAVRHSMVVIDAEKHKLDYKQSAEDNAIASLKKKYQGTYDEEGKYHDGASTLISRAKSETQVLKRKGSPKVNQEGKPWYDPSKPEGELIYKEVKEEYTDKNGKVHVRTQKSTKMAETTDARTLISDADTPQERAYAEYANSMKSYARLARMEVLATPNIEYSADAKKVYHEEVKSLNAKLNEAMKNAPRERQAQLMANAVIKAKKQDNPDMDSKEKKKISQQALTEARVKVGAKRNPFDITDREWEAIQSGAVSDHQLTQMLRYSDPDKLRDRATPKSRKELSEAKIARISAMKANGCTNAEIAQALGVSSTTVSKYVK